MCNEASYRITASGKAVTAWEHDPQRTRYLLDLLELLNTAGTGIAERQLRQFMPSGSLTRSIACLLQLGLIERNGRRDS